eukprot:scaffold7921_cov109-Isochrysis_galbana.AAC.6
MTAEPKTSRSAAGATGRGWYGGKAPARVRAPTDGWRETAAAPTAETRPTPASCAPPPPGESPAAAATICPPPAISSSLGSLSVPPPAVSALGSLSVPPPAVSALGSLSSPAVLHNTSPRASVPRLAAAPAEIPPPIELPTRIAPTGPSPAPPRDCPRPPAAPATSRQKSTTSASHRC